MHSNLKFLLKFLFWFTLLVTSIVGYFYVKWLYEYEWSDCESERQWMLESEECDCPPIFYDTCALNGAHWQVGDTLPTLPNSPCECVVQRVVNTRLILKCTIDSSYTCWGRGWVK